MQRLLGGLQLLVQSQHGFHEAVFEAAATTGMEHIVILLWRLLVQLAQLQPSRLAEKTLWGRIALHAALLPKDMKVYCRLC